MLFFGSSAALHLSQIPFLKVTGAVRIGRIDNEFMVLPTHSQMEDSDLDLVQTAPNVTYEILTRKGETILIDSPQKVPEAGQIEEFREPFVRISFLLPSENIGDLMQRWTGDRWISTLHRVVGAEGASPRRQSLVFFHNPRTDALIETLGDGTRYDPVRAGEYVLSRAAAAGL